jgi:hypothetical protein
MKHCNQSLTQDLITVSIFCGKNSWNKKNSPEISISCVSNKVIYDYKSTFEKNPTLD